VARDLTELTRIIRRIEAKSRARPATGSPRSLETLLDGRVEETERGKLLVVRRRFPVGHGTARSPCWPREPRRPRSPC
jgi:hypothetical protein